MPLTFEDLRKANDFRQESYGHACDHWGLTHWLTALAGELGEAANIIKKVERGDFTLEEAHSALRRELADVACYLDRLAVAAGIDLGDAVREKFNEVSERIGSLVRL